MGMGAGLRANPKTNREIMISYENKFIYYRSMHGHDRLHK